MYSIYSIYIYTFTSSHSLFSAGPKAGAAAGDLHPPSPCRRLCAAGAGAAAAPSGAGAAASGTLGGFNGWTWQGTGEKGRKRVVLWRIRLDFKWKIMEFHGINWISCRIKERWGVTLEKLESNRKISQIKLEIWELKRTWIRNNKTGRGALEKIEVAGKIVGFLLWQKLWVNRFFLGTSGADWRRWEEGAG